MSTQSTKQEQCVEQAITSFFQTHANGNVLLMTFTLTVLTNVILYSMMPKVSVLVHILLFFLFFSMYFMLSVFIFFYRMDKTVLSKELKKCAKIEGEITEKQHAKQQLAMKQMKETMEEQSRERETMAGGPPFRGHTFYRDQDIPSTIFSPSSPNAYNRDADLSEYTASLETKSNSLLSSFSLDKEPYLAMDNTTPSPLTTDSSQSDNYCFLGTGKYCSPACSGSPTRSECKNTYYAIPGPQWQPASASSMQKQMSQGQWTQSTCPITH
jgi:hypothetical protein